eukprot:1136917-Pelagomonas_calceolata.AAC.6
MYDSEAFGDWEGHEFGNGTEAPPIATLPRDAALALEVLKSLIPQPGHACQVGIAPLQLVPIAIITGLLCLTHGLVVEAQGPLGGVGDVPMQLACDVWWERKHTHMHTRRDTESLAAIFLLKVPEGLACLATVSIEKSKETSLT